MIINDCVSISSDIPAGPGSTLDLYFDPVQGTVVEDKTTCEGTHLVAETSVGQALDDPTDEQVIAVAEAILGNCSREHETRTMTDGNKAAFDTADNPTLTSGGLSRTKKTARAAFDKLIAEIHYDLHELHEIKEAIVDYYG
jgi:hypothetical protein